MVFVVGFPEQHNCKNGGNLKQVHLASLKCNQHLVNALRGFYVKLPNDAFDCSTPLRFLADGVHYNEDIYKQICGYFILRLRSIIMGLDGWGHGGRGGILKSQPSGFSYL
ncbi:unnamed protein product [Meganyctiphanes norvegica]|uniref:Uncharacterized protein n=1 Tax=Meganyctiphanes norvegica TaxID=48144 RepID=A0AAV2R992_MEGNR